MTNHTPQIILDKIKQENIKPKSKWYFIAKHAALWIPGIIVTGIGAVAVAGEIFAATHAGWEYREFIYRSDYDFILGTIPIIWVILFVAFASLIVKALRTTHSGYRFSSKNILAGSAITSIILGVCIYLLDDSLHANSIIRYPVHKREQGVWFTPSMGRLAGSIEDKTEDSLIIRDRDNVLWTIDMTGFGTSSFPFIEEGESIRIIGTSTDENIFIACAVFPWDIGEIERTSSNTSTQKRPTFNRNQNKNPDCKMILEELKKHMHRDERK